MYSPHCITLTHCLILEHLHQLTKKLYTYEQLLYFNEEAGVVFHSTMHGGNKERRGAARTLTKCSMGAARLAQSGSGFQANPLNPSVG